MEKTGEVGEYVCGKVGDMVLLILFFNREEFTTIERMRRTQI
jgi:hypothetical protein